GCALTRRSAFEPPPRARAGVAPPWGAAAARRARRRTATRATRRRSAGTTREGDARSPVPTPARSRQGAGAPVAQAPAARHRRPLTPEPAVVGIAEEHERRPVVRVRRKGVSADLLHRAAQRLIFVDPLAQASVECLHQLRR